MNSETSTEPDALQPWQLFTLAGLIGATIVVFLAEGHTPAGVILLSLTIFGAGAVGFAAWRTFAPFAGIHDQTVTPALGGRTRAGLEREKALVLRSLKELEFDRSMGKVSEKDYSEMSARLRGRAVRLIRQLDAGIGYREEIEREVERRTGPAVVPPSSSPAVTCGHCGAANDADARYCKRCGSNLEPSE